jgi:uncharacterized delta-60 repeat protein
MSRSFPPPFAGGESLRSLSLCRESAALGGARLRKKRSWGLLALAALGFLAGLNHAPLSPPAAQAQQAGSVDPSFGASLGLAGNVERVLVQPDGKVLVTGNFPQGSARLNANGSLDAGYKPEILIQGIVPLALQPDGKILIAGYRLNADGSADAGFQIAGFQPGSGPLEVKAVAVQGDGKIIVGGDFTVYNGVPRSCVARLNADGSLDASFDPGAGATDKSSFSESFESLKITSVILQPDGKIIVGGNFTAFNGVARNGIARLNPNGSVDGSFNPGSSADRLVGPVALQPDGKILVGGNFTAFNGVARNGLARLNPDGGVDEGFNPDANAFSSANALAVQPDGKIIVAAYDFNVADGTTSYEVIRLNPNGSLDGSFNPGTSVNGSIEAVAVQPDGKIILGGSFNTFGDTARNGIVRLNADGSADGAFQADLAPGLNAPVSAVATQPDGKVIVGGYFTTFDGVVARKSIARLNAGGDLDASFDPGAGAATDSLASLFLEAITVQPDGKILIGGNFTAFNGAARNGIARLNADGSLDAGFNPASIVRGFVSAVVLQPDGKILVGGSLYDGVTDKGLTRLNADGSLDAGFNPGASTFPSVSALALQPDRKILVGGFTDINGVPHAGIIRLNADGSLDAGFNRPADPTGAAFGTSIVALKLQPDGKIIVSGSFRTFGGVRRNGIARLNADGSLDGSFDAGEAIPGTVNALALQPDGKIVVVGFFSNILRLNANGSLDASFSLETNSSILDVTLQPDGRILVGGNFTQVGGVVRNYLARVDAAGLPDASFVPGDGSRELSAAVLQPDGKVLVGGQIPGGIARLNADGDTDMAFNVGIGADGRVSAIALQTDGKVLAGGSFTHFNGATALRLVRLLSNGQIDAAFAPVIDAPVAAIVIQSDGRIILGGDFTQVNGQPRAGLARLNADGSLDPSFVLDVEDGPTASAAQARRPLAASAVGNAPLLRADAASGSRKVKTLALSPQADGSSKLIIGGNFSKVLGVVRQHLAQVVLTANGSASLDGSFDPGAGPDAVVNAAVMQADGRLLVGGDFVNIGGVRRQGLARLNANGSVDETFDAGLQASGASAVSVRSLVLAVVKGGGFGAGQPGGERPVRKAAGDEARLVLGGSFGKVGDSVRQGVARLLLAQGAADASFNPGAGADGAVNALAPQPDGRTIIAGAFNSVDGLPRKGVARLLGDNDANLPVITLKAVSDASEGGSIGQLRLRRKGGDANAELIVKVAFVGKAKNGTDYVFKKGTIKLKAGKTSKIIKIVSIDDALPEGPEKVAIKLLPDAAYTISANQPAKVKITIQDND